LHHIIIEEFAFQLSRLGEHLCPHFLLQPPWGNINNGKKDVKDNRKSLMVGQNVSKAAERKKTPEIS